MNAEDELANQVADLTAVANRFGVGLFGGIDVPSMLDDFAKSSDPMLELVKQNRLPFFGFAVGDVITQTDDGPVWRQTSTTAAHVEFVDDRYMPGSDRVVTIDGIRIGVLICGELFNWMARENVAGANVKLVADLGHAGMGQGLIPAMRRVAREGPCAVVHSQHLSTWWGRSFHFVSQNAEPCSRPIDESHLIAVHDQWAACLVRNLED